MHVCRYGLVAKDADEGENSTSVGAVGASVTPAHCVSSSVTAAGVSPTAAQHAHTHAASALSSAPAEHSPTDSSGSLSLLLSLSLCLSLSLSQVPGVFSPGALDKAYALSIHIHAPGENTRRLLRLSLSLARSLSLLLSRSLIPLCATALRMPA
jgi:hypothetical protein